MNDRAMELKPAEPNRFHALACEGWDDDPVSFTKWRAMEKEHSEQYGDDDGRSWSAIEVYITMKGSKRKSLVEYIKGERETFTA